MPDGHFENNGILNNFLMWLGVIDQPLVILHTNGGVYRHRLFLSAVYGAADHTALIRLDYSLVEASLDLGPGR